MFNSEPLLGFHVCHQITAPLAGLWSGPSHVHITSSSARVKFLNRTNQTCGFNTNTSFVSSQNLKRYCGYLCVGHGTCTSLDTRFSRRDTHLLTTVGNIRKGRGTVCQEVPQIREKNVTAHHGQYSHHMQQSWKRAESTVRFCTANAGGHFKQRNA